MPKKAYAAGTIFSMHPQERAVILDLTRSNRMRTRMDTMRLALHKSGLLSEKQKADVLEPRKTV